MYPSLEHVLGSSLVQQTDMWTDSVALTTYLLCALSTFSESQISHLKNDNN